MAKSIFKAIGLITAGLVVAWLGFLSFVYMKMKAPPEQFGAFMSKLPMPFYFVLPFETLWFRARAGTINVGDTAPDFALSTLDKSGVGTGCLPSADRSLWCLCSAATLDRHSAGRIPRSTGSTNNIGTAWRSTSYTSRRRTPATFDKWNPMCGRTSCF